MPVAGNNVECFVLRLEKGKLVEGTPTRRLSFMTTDDPMEAVRLLRRGDVVFLKAYGDNLSLVRAVIGGSDATATTAS